MEEEVPTRPEHLSSLQFWMGFVLLDLLFSVICFGYRCLSFFFLQQEVGLVGSITTTYAISDYHH